jgi:putative hydrolase of the HAD superfamily
MLLLFLFFGLLAQHRDTDVPGSQIAPDFALAPCQNVVFIENTAMFVQNAEGLGFQSLLHTDYKPILCKPGSLRIAELSKYEYKNSHT